MTNRSNRVVGLGGRQIEVLADCRLSSSAKAVWALIGNFGEPQTWLPGIHKIEMQHAGATEVRICRTVVGEFREQLTGMGSMWCTYVILSGPLPVLNYEASLGVAGEENSDSCRVQWKSAFDATRGTGLGVARRKVAQLYDAGLRALQARFGSNDLDPLFFAGKLKGAVPIQTFLDNFA